jgi:alginate O-acetyltransferase complex protein AlgI
MITTSSLFLGVFVPLAAGIFRFVNSPKLRIWFFLLVSLFLYATLQVVFVPLLLIVSWATFLLAQQRKTALGIAVNILSLLVFKYIWGAIAPQMEGLLFPFTPFSSLFPIGISFYTFKNIGYLVDVHQEKHPASKDFLLYAAFTSFFPQIASGPISNYMDFDRQASNLRTPALSQYWDSFIMITIGLFKKILIADTLQRSFTTTLLTSTDIGATQAWFSVFAYSIQIYFDFSGYTDITLGIAGLFGMSLPQNFSNPYLSSNPREFWQRWHISLSEWFRTYFFSPLSRYFLKRFGSKYSELLQYLSNFLTMLLVGLWHGASWTYVMWGGYHGILLNLHSSASRRQWKFSPGWLNRILLLIAVMVGWVFFLSPNLGFATQLFANMAGLHGLQIDWLQTPNLLSAWIAISIALVMIVLNKSDAINYPRTNNRLVALLLGIIFALTLMNMGDITEFIYVRF